MDAYLDRVRGEHASSAPTAIAAIPPAWALIARYHIVGWSSNVLHICTLIGRLARHYIARVPNLTRTLALIKPDAFDRRLTGKIIDIAHDAGLTIVAMKSVNLNRNQAEAFYAVHRERPFFASLVAFMTAGTTVAMVLEGSDAVPAWRDAMGATDPAEAAPGTIRRRFAESIERNCCHGSDSDANAAVEIGCFFSGQELLR